MSLSRESPMHYSYLQKVTTMFISLRPWLLAFSTVVAVMMLSATGAKAQTCTVVTAPSFGTMIVDPVSSGTISASSSSKITFNCSSNVPFSKVQICFYIGVTPDQAGATDFAFNMRQPSSSGSDGSRLAWQIVNDATAKTPLKRDGTGDIGTGGFVLYEPSGAKATHLLGGLKSITISFPNRQLQDRVRPGIYTGTFQLVSKYMFNPGNARCTSGLPTTNGTVRTPITLTARVLPACQFENFSDVDFGSQGSVQAANARIAGIISKTGNIGVRCTYATPYKISIGDGNNANAGIRRMKNGNNYLAYQLFQPDCKTVWSTTPALTLSGVGNTVNALNNHLVCAQLTTPVAVAPVAGTYSDTVIATITF